LAQSFPNIDRITLFKNKKKSTCEKRGPGKKRDRIAKFFLKDENIEVLNQSGECR
jgi:hypothetical protein